MDLEKESGRLYHARGNMWCYSRDNVMSLIKERLYDCAGKALAQLWLSTLSPAMVTASQYSRCRNYNQLPN